MVDQVKMFHACCIVAERYDLCKFVLPGEIITFDQLALRAPTGKNTLMIQGKNC